MPGRLKIVLWVAALSGAATLSGTLALAGDEGFGPVAVVAAFAVFLTLSWTFPLRVLRQEETVAYHLDEAFLVAMALIVPPVGIVVAFGSAVLVSHLALRRPLVRGLFNSSVMLTSSALALG